MPSGKKIARQGPKIISREKSKKYKLEKIENLDCSGWGEKLKQLMDQQRKLEKLVYFDPDRLKTHLGR